MDVEQDTNVELQVNVNPDARKHFIAFRAATIQKVIKNIATSELGPKSNGYGYITLRPQNGGDDGGYDDGGDDIWFFFRTKTHFL